MTSAPDVTATVVAHASVVNVYAALTQPDRVGDLVRGIAPAIAAAFGRDESAAGAAEHARWLFRTDRDTRRIHWELTSPLRVAGTLDVFGGTNLTQLWITISRRPARWDTAQVRDLAQQLLQHIVGRLQAA